MITYFGSDIAVNFPPFVILLRFTVRKKTGLIPQIPRLIFYITLHLLPIFFCMTKIEIDKKTRASFCLKVATKHVKNCRRNRKKLVARVGFSNTMFSDLRKQNTVAEH